MINSLLSISESETKEEKNKGLQNRKISINLNNGDFFEQFLINRIDRDVFDLKYHSQISRPKELDYSEL